MGIIRVGVRMNQLSGHFDFGRFLDMCLFTLIARNATLTIKCFFGYAYKYYCLRIWSFLIIILFKNSNILK